MHSRLEIQLNNYCNLVNIEAKTMVDMAKKEILPAVSEYSQVLSQTILAKTSVCKSLDCTYETEILTEISSLTASAYNMLKHLENALRIAEREKDAKARSVAYKTSVLPAMTLLRKDVDALENLVSAEYWPIPTYGDLLFEV